MPSTSSPGIRNETPRLWKAVSDAERSTLVPMAYWLFSITYTTGSFHSWAMLKLS
jgi:hypothetical protein